MKVMLMLAMVIAGPALAATNGLVGWWRFSDSDGRQVRDVSGQDRHGKVLYGEMGRDLPGTPLLFDGFDTRVEIPAEVATPFTDQFTACFWVRADEARRGTVLFGIQHTNDSWTTPMFGMYVDNERAVFGLSGSRDVPKTLVAMRAPLPRKAWVHLAATYDGRAARLFVNGLPDAEAARTGLIARNGQPLLVGRGLGYARPALRGAAAELRLYNRALSAAEVRAQYEETRPVFGPAPPAERTSPDGTVVVETKSGRPDADGAWTGHPTRLLELVAGYTSQAERVRVNAYGSDLDAPRSEATGFFRIERVGARQWLIDPEGFRHYSVCVNAVQPPRSGQPDGWPEWTTGMLRTNGFNGLGNWSASNLRGATHPLTWVARWNFMFEFARQRKLTEPASGTVGFTHKCMPVFHRDFPAFCDRFATNLQATARDPYLVGIMTDNELQCPVDLLDRYLTLDAANPDLRDGRDAAEAWLKARTGSLDTAPLSRRDRYEFIAFAFARYYELVTAAIRRHDTNHLYLGSRINYSQGQFDNPWFWKVLARNHDVVSVNYYNRWGPQPDQFAQWEQWAGRPVLLTEWYAKAMDVPGLANTFGAGWLVRTQEDRARYYQHFALNALEVPSIVGWHFFKYMDDPPESTALDSAGGTNKGLVNTREVPYAPLLERVRAVNREVYPLIQFLDRRAGREEGKP